MKQLLVYYDKHHICKTKKSTFLASEKISWLASWGWPPIVEDLAEERGNKVLWEDHPYQLRAVAICCWIYNSVKHNKGADKTEDWRSRCTSSRRRRSLSEIWSSFQQCDPNKHYFLFLKQVSFWALVLIPSDKMWWFWSGMQMANWWWKVEMVKAKRVARVQEVEGASRQPLHWHKIPTCHRAPIST